MVCANISDMAPSVIDKKVNQSWQENQQPTGYNPPTGQGYQYPHRHLIWSCPQIPRRFQYRDIQLFKSHHQRQHHERKIIGDHAKPSSTIAGYA